MRGIIIRKFLKIRLIFLIFIVNSTGINYFFNDNLSLKASQINDQSINKTDSKILNTLGDEYILGLGDSIFINFLSTPIFNGIYTINPEGDIFLPELNRFKAKNLTINDLEKKLNESYKQFIFNPEIRVAIQTYRPVNVYIRGEVKRPGLYTFNLGSINLNNSSYSAQSLLSENNSYNNIEKSSLNIRIPKLFDALRAANGLNGNADLSNIILIRNNSLSNGGGKIFTEINLLSLFVEGDQTNNVRLFDGDSILVKKGDNINKQLIDLNKTNVSPDKIIVYLSGNIENTGQLKIKYGSSLTQAIAAAGGEKIFSGKILFLRFNADGGIIRRKFNLDKNASVNSYKNPILKEGDIIEIKRSLLVKTTSTLNAIGNPIISGYSLYKIFSD